MSGFITSSANPPQGKSDSGRGPSALRAAVEGAVIVAAAGALAAGEAQRRWLWTGLGLAWAAGTAGTWALARGKGRSSAAFWRAFGLGMALRMAVLVAVVVWGWRRPWQQTGAVLGAYAAGLTAVMLVEFRHLVRDLKR